MFVVTNDNEGHIDICGLCETMWMSVICVASGKPCGSSWSLLPVAVMGKKSSVAMVLMTPDL